MKRPPSPVVDGLRALREISAIEAAEAIEQPLLDYLAAEFAIDDKVALREAILTMAHSYEGAEPFKSEIEKRLTKRAARLDALNDVSDLKYDLADQLRRPDESLDEAAERVGAELDVLQAAIRRVALGPPKSGQGRKAHLALRSLVSAARAYWTWELGRNFSADQNWRVGPSGRREPYVDAERFCFEVVRYLAPGKEGGVGTVAREFTSRHLQKRDS